MTKRLKVDFVHDFIDNDMKDAVDDDLKLANCQDADDVTAELLMKGNKKQL